MTTVNFIDALPHNTVGKALITVETILIVLDVTSIGLRIWARRILGVSLQVSDYLMLGVAVGCAWFQNRAAVRMPLRHRRL